MSASPESPLPGRCGCGAVRFEVRGPFTRALYCHCHRCQRRTGGAYSAGPRVARADFAILRGGELIRPGIRPEYRQWVSSAVAWEPIPDDGLPRYEEAAP